MVLDSSATLAWLYPDETTTAVEQVFESVASNGAVVPAHWRLEVGNGLTVSVRRRRITSAFRADALNVLGLSPIAVDPDTDSAAWQATLQLADRFGLTLYDAAYLELAQRRALPLATLDQALRTAAAALGIGLRGL